MDTWQLLQQVVKNNLKIDPVVLDYVATHDILKMCVSGKSISTIANELEEEPEYVSQTIQDLLFFDGFLLDIDFDCRNLYEKYRYNRYAYLSIASTFDPYATKELLRESYRINKLFDLIEKAVEKYYE